MNLLNVPLSFPIFWKKIQRCLKDLHLVQVLDVTPGGGSLPADEHRALHPSDPHRLVQVRVLVADSDFFIHFDVKQGQMPIRCARNAPERNEACNSQ